MLNDSLVATLIKKNILKERTIVESKAIVTSFTGKSSKIDEFVVSKIKFNNKGNYIFELLNLEKGDKKIALSIDILTLEGMSPETLAEAYELKVDGSKKAFRKTRGRPKKVRSEVLV